MKVWCINPQSGGTKIPPDNYSLILAQAAAHEIKQAWYPEFKLKLRFKGQFCYLDGFKEGKEPFPIGRLRYFQGNEWTLAFYTYSNERYEPCVFQNGDWFGTLENAINICSMYLTN
jgi:hypothetical protein